MILSDKNGPKMENDQLVSDSQKITIKVKRARRWFFTVEPVLMVISFCTGLTGSLSVNLMETRICLNEFNLGDQNCSQPLSEPVERLVQPKTALVITLISVLQAVIPCVLSLYVGPWSDQNGRKPFLIVSFAGFACSYLVWTAITILKQLQVYFFLLGPLLSSMSGDLMVINICCYCYISDISSEKDRALRLTIMQSASLLGTVSGYLSSVKLLHVFLNYAYTVAYIIATFSCLLCVVYIMLFVPESITIREDRDKVLFNTKQLKNIITVATEKKPNYDRGVTLSLISASFLMNFLISGEGSVKFLVLKNAYLWTLEDFNHFCAVTETVCVVISIVGIYVVQKKIGLPDTWTAVFASSLWCLSDLLCAVSTTSLLFWIYSLIGSFAALFGPTIGSMLSKSVPHKDIGKIFALESALRSLSPFTAAPLFALLYTSIYLTRPLWIYFLSAAFGSALLAITLYVGASGKFKRNPVMEVLSLN